MKGSLQPFAGLSSLQKRIPGFAMLSQDDQVTLLKAGVFEVLLVRLACMFDSQTNSMICLNGLVLRREALHSVSNARFLMDSMFKFAEGMNGLKLTDHELGIVLRRGRHRTWYVSFFPSLYIL